MIEYTWMFLNMFAYEIDLSMWGNYAADCNYVFAFETQTFLFEEDVFGARFYKSDPGPPNSAPARNLRSNA